MISIRNHETETPTKPDTAPPDTQPKRHTQPAPLPLDNPDSEPSHNPHPSPGVCPVGMSLANLCFSFERSL